jgi:hypothetical protein
MCGLPLAQFHVGSHCLITCQIPISLANTSTLRSAELQKRASLSKKAAITHTPSRNLSNNQDRLDSVSILVADEIAKKGNDSIKKRHRTVAP